MVFHVERTLQFCKYSANLLSSMHIARVGSKRSSVLYYSVSISVCLSFLQMSERNFYYNHGCGHLRKRTRNWQEEEDYDGMHSGANEYRLFSSGPKFSHGGSDPRSSHGGHSSVRSFSRGASVPGSFYEHHASSRRFSHGASVPGSSLGDHSSSRNFSHGASVPRSSHSGHSSSDRVTPEDHGGHASSASHNSPSSHGDHPVPRFSHGGHSPVSRSSRYSSRTNSEGHGSISREPHHGEFHPITSHRGCSSVSRISRGSHSPVPKSSPVMGHRSPLHGGHHSSPSHRGCHSGNRSPSPRGHHSGRRSPSHRVHQLSPSHKGHQSGRKSPSHGGHHSGHTSRSHEGHRLGHHMQERLPGRIRYLSIEGLRKLAQSSSVEIVACVNENETGFLAAYSHDKYCKDPSMMKRLIKLLYLLAKADDFERIARRILARILSPDGTYALFLMKLDCLIKEMITEHRSQIRNENPQYLNYLVDIGSKAIKIIPSTVMSTYPVPVIIRTIEDLKRRGEILDTLYHKAKSLEEAFKLAQEEQSKPESAMDIDRSDQMSPPEHFTNVEVLPSLEEVHSGDDEIYLRPNIVKGGYNNWEHYFDVQYRLLREDFVRPLRHGIQHYCAPGTEKQRSHDVTIYEHVQVLSPVCLFAGMGFEIQFDTSRMSQVNWEHSRRLIYGSLLCLSVDNFRHSIVFATVVKRDPILLKEGRLTVKFEGDVSVFHFNPNNLYAMVESTAYFEASKHILSKLKELSSQSDEIPFKPYIVECNFCDVPPPSYSSKHDEFELHSILGVRSKVVLHNKYSWPSAQSTNLDTSQLEALKMALTKEVSVIQGPPGTGKTFIGLKIVEAFLKNRSTWDRNKEAPILVVCYTNHALDQFLEGIHALSIDEQTPNIIRIGGRCKSEKLSRYVLRNKVNECQNIPRALYGKLRESRKVMFEIKGFISRQILTAGEDLGYLAELESVMSSNHYKQLCRNGRSSEGREVEIWLELLGPVGSRSYPNSGMVADSAEAAIAAKVRDSDGCIEVDNEAQLMEDDRILEGEEVEFLDLADDLEYGSTLGKRKPEAIPKNQAKRRRLAYERSDFNWRFSEQNAGDKTTVEVHRTKSSHIISEGLKNDPMSHDEVQLVGNIWKLSLNKRWQLYNYWMKEYAILCYTRYEEACERQSMCLKEIDEFVLRNSDVIGITTTGAAKHHHILKKIHPKVVIFEEAAEILEAHIVTSLTPSVQQLVLIGDHKQLRPKPNCHDLEVKYKLSVSLFERLVKNGIPYVTLNVQHRMRPEVSRLVSPSIYNDLKDHETVQRYDSVLGVAKDVFFIDHNESEKHNEDGSVTTHANFFEATYLVSLCRYLLRQGYDPHDITILTAYRGQLMELKRRMQRKDFEGVRVAAVDDFQGEENEIILLSLVRSNPEENIGFLSDSNRTCVALSRAKKGLYVVGNLSMFRGKEKTVWPEIISDLERRQCVGKALPLHCRVHQETKVFAAVPEDFDRCPEGGCDEVCRVRLSCGHYCPRVCHPDDRDHERYGCLKDCPNILPCEHKCLSKCYKCFSGCEPCSEIVTKVLPVCKHAVRMTCSADPVKFLCLEVCGKTLECGHACQNKCSEPCIGVKCNVKVEKTLQCGHKVSEPCHMPSRKISCREKCTSILECGHPCRGTCGSCHMGRLHMRCRQDCNRQLVCGHICKSPCASVCPPCDQRCNNFCVHSQCPKKCYEVCVPCTEPCLWQCKHFRCSRACGEVCDRPCCDMPCDKLLECGHQCIGLCGEKCPKLCRLCDRDQVNETFFGTEDEEDAHFIQLEDCNHFFEATSLDRWINEQTDTEVKFPTCPRCRVPVRKSLRYGNIIKQTLRDVAEIKRKQLLPQKDTLSQFESFSKKSKSSDYFKNEVQVIGRLLKKDHLHPFTLNAISVQIAIFERVLKVKEILSHITRSAASKLRSRYEVCDMNLIADSLEALKLFLMQDFLSAQQISEAFSEIRRVSCTARLCDLLCKLEQMTVSPEDKDKLPVSPEDKDKLDKAVQQIQTSGRWESEKMTEESETVLYEFIEELSKKYNVLQLSPEERQAVVDAVGLKVGHWFKCKNGHLYCIGECGGAMEESKCPECGERIGGRRHRLADGNVHAPEMDGSSHPAWSEQANMANYELQ